jgi:tetratricopeptide (TPR) repeat protein
MSTTRAQRIAAAAAAFATLLAVSMAWMLWKRPPLDERAWILTADFDNRTGDPVFDRSLDVALYAGLAQSQYVAIFPRARVQQTLTRMGRTNPPAKLDEALAREVAEREGINAIVVGSIDRVDSTYMLSLHLVDPGSGSAIAVEGRVAKNRTEVINAIDDLIRRLRRDIGESASQLAKHDRPLPRATTRSLEALRKYGEGIAASRAGQRAVAVELWEQAVALDSDFALAHAELGAAYYFGNDRPRGDQHFARALSNLDRLTDRERLVVRASAESWRGNREGAIELRRALLAEYPADPNAWYQIGYDYLRLGRSGEAIEAFRKHLLRDSTDAGAYINLGTVLSSSGDRGEGLRQYAKGFALEPTLLMTNNLNHEYGRALILAGRLHDARSVYDTMRHGNPDQRAQGERSIALLYTYQGHYGEAIEHFRSATLLSQRPLRELTEARNRLFLASAEQEKGWNDSVTMELRASHALFRKAYFEPQFLVYLGKALVLGKQIPLAVEVLDTLKKRAQPNNAKDRSNLAVLTGELALASGRVDSAVRVLRAAYAGDESPYVAESLARALVAAGDYQAAAKLYETYGTNVAGWYGMEAQAFGMRAFYAAAVVYERMKDTSAALGAYERFLAQRATADSDLVVIKDARDRVLKLRLAKGALAPVNK